MQNFAHLATYHTNGKVVVDDIERNFFRYHFTIFFVKIVFTSFAVFVLIGDGNAPSVQHCFGRSFNFLKLNCPILILIFRQWSFKNSLDFGDRCKVGMDNFFRSPWPINQVFSDLFWVTAVKYFFLLLAAANSENGSKSLHKSILLSDFGALSL